MSKFTILQTAVADYRGKFYDSIRRQLGASFALYGGTSYFESSVLSDPEISYYEVKNNYFLGRRLLWQKGVLHLAKEKGVLVLEMNPRILSNWYLLLLRKQKKLPTILWGHAWPRSGKKSKTDSLRHFMRKLADTIIVYTNEQQRELKQKMPKMHIVAAPNALFYKNDMESIEHPNPKNIIYVGRLTKAKKPLFLVKSFYNIINELPPETTLCIVGEGEEKSKLQDFINQENLEKRVKLLGHISDYEQLKMLYADSLFSISPGYVGLSITQSFGFGVPMLISKNEQHSPEIEAVIEGENAIFYETDDLSSFKKEVLEIFKNEKKWNTKRKSISLFCQENYSVEVMAQRFINVNNHYGS